MFLALTKLENGKLENPLNSFLTKPVFKSWLNSSNFSKSTEAAELMSKKRRCGRGYRMRG